MSLSQQMRSICSLEDGSGGATLEPLLKEAGARAGAVRDDNGS